MSFPLYINHILESNKVLSNCYNAAIAHSVLCRSQKRKAEVSLGSALIKIINCAITC